MVKVLILKSEQSLVRWMSKSQKRKYLELLYFNFTREWQQKFHHIKFVDTNYNTHFHTWPCTHNWYSINHLIVIVANQNFHKLRRLKSSLLSLLNLVIPLKHLAIRNLINLFRPFHLKSIKRASTICTSDTFRFIIC